VFNSLSRHTTAGKLRWVSLTAAILVYIQCLLGGLVGSRWALHQCFGGSQLCAVMNSHIIGVVPATLVTLAVVFMAWRTPVPSSYLEKTCLGSWGSGGSASPLRGCDLLPTFTSGTLNITHHTVGAALFGTLVALTTLGMRDVS
jgi:cytochrome c oxidase assembly protein subunit 15